MSDTTYLKESNFCRLFKLHLEMIKNLFIMYFGCLQGETLYRSKLSVSEMYCLDLGFL